MHNQENDRSETYRIKLSPEHKHDARIIASEYVFSGARVLDVGCACGDFGVFLKEQFNCTMHGMEYNPESLLVAQGTQAYEQLHQVNLEHFNTDAFANYYGYFDYIFILDVLEHIRYPESALLSLSLFLKPTGAFVISLPNIAFCDIKASLLCGDFEYTEMGILDKTHIRFYTYKSIANLFSSVNLIIDDCKLNVHDWSSKPLISWLTKRTIESDPHSFIFQYVTLVSLGTADKGILAKKNTELLFAAGNKAQSHLHKIRLANALNSMFPVGTHRGHIARRIQSLLMKNKQRNP